ncbi:MAG: tRNA preQ1(34) S-adenosylmethionine ribosyltransferase-isomerase QueA [Rhodospirillaceae bacterium]|nr:tRNA preQ1(34) S-adenosylmethionine ribosyltransferase-isomerase QueA [Rhodospirillaceae bacterium]|tara:strand:+ start:880 stop:1890 length:1011 start_codon:yes stop_codon:yes gene_type:complete
MDRTDFHYDLPASLIAQEPLAERKSSRLLVLRNGKKSDRRFLDLPELLGPNDLLVLNDTRVIKARFYGRKSSGGAIEVLIERIRGNNMVTAHVRASKGPRIGAELFFSDGVKAKVKGRIGSLFDLSFNVNIESFIEVHGKVPLPPYIERVNDYDDIDRYQTVYARKNGAVAAPTAGLHFDDVIFNRLHKKGIETEFLTLHIGAGTFSPVRTQRIEDHELHFEWLCVSETLCELILKTKERGGRVVAVGTTVVRALETAALGGELKPFEGETNLFIYPGFDFKVTDLLLTNFHLPESSLLMLVSALAGREIVLDAYRHAVKEEYRFFSYGDAMLVEP